MTNLLGINFNHDGAGAILSDGRLAGFVNTERFSRRRKHPGLRECDLAELLGQAGLSLADIDHVLLCNLHNMDSADIPRTHGSDLKETWLAFEVDEAGGTVTIDGRTISCTVNPDHHLLHYAAVFYTSPFESAMVFSADPVGVGTYAGRGNRGTRVENFDVPFTAHRAYTVVAAWMFGTGIFGAGKLMGLAPYGCPASDDVDYASIRTMPELYRLASRNPIFVEEGGRNLNATLAYHVQHGLEVQLTHALRGLYDRSRELGVEPNLCLSGGTALNSVANQIAFSASGFSRLHLHPACGDDGTAIGAVLWHWHDRLNGPRRRFTNRELMYSIRSYDDAVDRALGRHRDSLAIEERPDYCRVAAELIADGHIVGWFQGPSEIGPRALGNRSILADPRGADMKDRLNRRVKLREGFRPFAPAVLNEYSEEWFGIKDSPFMLRVSGVLKSGVPAVTHVDGTARVQTVSAEDNPAFHALIAAFHERTGVPLVLNTSFNIGGEPIVETPEDAIRSFLNTGLDCLIFPGRIVHKAGAAARPGLGKPEVQAAC